MEACSYCSLAKYGAIASVQNIEFTAQHDETATRNTCGDCIQAKHGMIVQYGVFLVHQKTWMEATGNMEASRQNME
jgi:hypothetical protein